MHGNFEGSAEIHLIHKFRSLFVDSIWTPIHLIWKYLNGCFLTNRSEFQTRKHLIALFRSQMCREHEKIPSGSVGTLYDYVESNKRPRKLWFSPELEIFSKAISRNTSLMFPCTEESSNASREKKGESILHVEPSNSWSFIHYFRLFRINTPESVNSSFKVFLIPMTVLDFFTMKVALRRPMIDTRSVSLLLLDRLVGSDLGSFLSWTTKLLTQQEALSARYAKLKFNESIPNCFG